MMSDCKKFIFIFLLLFNCYFLYSQKLATLGLKFGYVKCQLIGDGYKDIADSSKWHEIIGGQTIADAILDRIVHDTHRIEMKAESLRKKKQPKNQEEIVLQNFKN